MVLAEGTEEIPGAIAEKAERAVLPPPQPPSFPVCVCLQKTEAIAEE